MTFNPQTVWRYARLDDLRPAQHDDAEEGLSDDERAELNHWRNPRRREEWLLGRVLARQLVAEELGDSSAIEILSRDGLGRSVRPIVTIAGQPLPVSLSISHTRLAVLVALCAVPGVSIGADLVPCAPLGNGLMEFWFDEQEQLLAENCGALEACRLWAAKEAVYKAANENDSFAPRQISLARAVVGGEFRCTYRGAALGDRCRISTWDCDEHFAVIAVVDRRPAGDSAGDAIQKVDLGAARLPVESDSLH
jgi:phosphopantetheinyl transferase